MKLATLKDGRFVVVSRDLTLAVPATDIAASMLDALDNWNAVAIAIDQRYEALNTGRLAEAFAFDPRQAAAPIPKPRQWLDASAFENHGRLMEKAFALPPADYTVNPLMYQGNADDFIGPHDEVLAPSEADNMDFEAELGVVLDETPMGASQASALSHVRLLVLINDVSLRAHAVREMKSGFGWVQAKPSTALAPVAVTPDELGKAWANGRCSLAIRCERNRQWFGHPNGKSMTFGFDQIIAYAAYSRPLHAGTIIGSGTFSNPERDTGSACIAERRAIEMIEQGQPRTPFLHSAERVRIEMLGEDGQSVFGAIDQVYVCLPFAGATIRKVAQ
jgi:fumarylacetoacetate (FAA) hydrolase